MRQLKILVLEDDPLAQWTMGAHLKGHAVEITADPLEAKKRLAKGTYDLCFLDLELGPKDDCSGLGLIPTAVAKGTYAVVMSAHESEDVIARAYALGCKDYYAKGAEKANIERVFKTFMDRNTPLEDTLFKETFVTEDPQTRSGVREALDYASSDLPILILGPSGTGKTSLARIIHDRSARTGEFVAINCAAFTEDLLEAELFGYRRGAFTGAESDRKGKLLAAHQGTLFLDEVGAMSLKMQSQLLKAIEERTFHPVGSDKPETAQFRLISATLESPEELIASGRMRQDFFQRIHGATVELRPLAERTCDVFPLIAFFTRKSRRLGFSPEAKKRLLCHDWPGNIRELRRFVELLSAGREGLVSAQAVDRLLHRIHLERGARPFVTDEHVRFAYERGLGLAVDRFVDEVLKCALAGSDGNRAKVMRDLRISSRILYKSIKRSQDISNGPRVEIGA